MRAKKAVDLLVMLNSFKTPVLHRNGMFSLSASAHLWICISALNVLCFVLSF